MPDWTISESGSVPAIAMEAELIAERQMTALLRESLADVEAMFGREDMGWQRVGQEAEQFSPNGRKRIAALSRLMATCDPLIKRGLGLRVAYIHGPGITVTVRDDGADGQDVQAAYAAFREDPMVQETFAGAQAREDLERQLGTAGEFFLAYPTDQATGAVQVRSIDPDQIVQIIRDPEDDARVWFYKREWVAQTTDLVTGNTTGVQRTTYYPALGYRPIRRPDRIGTGEVRWDAPMLHVYVNDPGKSGRGIGDVFAALPWAKANKDFLERFAVYMQAMVSIIAQVKTKASKAQQAARQASAIAPTSSNPGGVAGIVATDPNSSIEFLSKSGAAIDADSHRPFATMVAAALGVPLTMLLGDPGATGARAVAETLDQPMELEIGLRHKVWDTVETKTADYVIDQAVIAPRGMLRGQFRQDGDRVIVTLPEGDERTLDIQRPPFDSTPLDTLVKAIAAADQTDKMPPLVIARLLLAAFEVDDIDELLDALTDDDGNWIGPDDGSKAATQAADRGEGVPPVVPEDEPEPDPADDGN